MSDDSTTSDPRARRWRGLLPQDRVIGSITGAATTMAAITAFAPTVIPPFVGFALLLLLAVGAVVLHVRCERLDPSSSRRLLGPLTLFTLAFLIVLGSRAVSLGLETEGRYFRVDMPAGTTSARFLDNAIPDPDTSRRPLDPWVPPFSDSEVFDRSLTFEEDDDAPGSGTFTVDVEGEGGSYVDILVGRGHKEKIPVQPGRTVTAAATVHRLSDSAVSTNLVLQFYDSGAKRLTRKLLEPLPASTAGPTRLRGSAIAPAGAASVLLGIELRDPGDEYSHQLAIEDPELLPLVAPVTGDGSRADLEDNRARWEDAYAQAISLCVALLAAVLAGYGLGIGSGLARRLPALALPRRSSRRERLLMFGVLAVGIVAYALEMRGYGGYRAYLDGVQDIANRSRGRWYLHAAATLPLGMAVMLVTRWITDRSQRRTRIELAIVLVAVALACSYWLKAAVAIPALTTAFVLYRVRPRVAVGVLVSGAALFLMLTPFVYIVRGDGAVRWGTLLTSEYWHDLVRDASSRFFHFESLMISVPDPGKWHAWQPVAEFFATIVPRQLWEGKPESTAVRFTEQYLTSGLHTATDIGVVSLPGELWIIGGPIGILVGGLMLGVLARLCQGMFNRGIGAPGTLLLACGIFTWIVFVNDGWGLAPSLIQVLIASAGWLVFLRPARGLTSDGVDAR